MLVVIATSYGQNRRPALRENVPLDSIRLSDPFIRPQNIDVLHDGYRGVVVEEQ